MQSDIKLCSFDASFKTNVQYVCERYETCCKNGCCSTYSYKYLHTWYFWAVMILLIGAFYGMSECCKKLEKTHRRRLALQRNQRRLPEPNRENYLVDNFLDRIFSSYETQHDRVIELPMEPPPKYSDAINMPRLNNSNAQVDCSNAEADLVEDTVPTYEEVIKNQQKDEKQ